MLDKEKEEVLLRFLQLTKEGKYAEVNIDEQYVRFPYLRFEEENEYYYILR